MKHLHLVIATLVLVGTSTLATAQDVPQNIDWRTADLQASEAIFELGSSYYERSSARAAWRALKRTAECSGNACAAQTLQELKDHLNAPYEIGVLKVRPAQR
jgi:hypothetical protein